jgi:hypothetical protein
MIIPPEQVAAMAPPCRACDPKNDGRVCFYDVCGGICCSCNAPLADPRAVPVADADPVVDSPAMVSPTSLGLRPDLVAEVDTVTTPPWHLRNELGQASGDVCCLNAKTLYCPEHDEQYYR